MEALGRRGGIGAGRGTVIGVRIYQQNLIKDSTITLNGGLSLRQFNSYDELKAEVDRIHAERQRTDPGEVINGISDFFSGNFGAKADHYNGGYTSDRDMAAESSQTGSTGSSSGSGAASDSHSETYKQVDGVDEADIIKTDGRFIYCADGSYITIFSAKGDAS